MNTPRLPFPLQSDVPTADEARPGFRTKTVATRLTPGELAEVEAAAEGAGQSLAEWLRESALRATRQRPADPLELLLAEIWAVRYTLLNLFHAGAQAASEGPAIAARFYPQNPRPGRRPKASAGTQTAGGFPCP